MKTWKLKRRQCRLSQLFAAVVIVVVQPLSRVRLFATPWTAARQASLSITNSWSLPKLVSIQLVMPSNHLILCHPLLLLPSIFPSIRVFSNELALHIKWPKYWSFSFSISPSSEYSGLLFFRICWFDLSVLETRDPNRFTRLCSPWGHWENLSPRLFQHLELCPLVPWLVVPPSISEASSAASCFRHHGAFSSASNLCLL